MGEEKESKKEEPKRTNESPPKPDPELKSISIHVRNTKRK